ncbi:MAG: hypothetical protein LDL19_09925, partial [Thiobacillus sp.]|nr:hypothetical protein [Thiobacillus sp.]
MSQRSSRSRRMARAAGPLALFPFLLTPAGKIGAGALATALIAGGMLAKAPPDAPNPVAGGPRPAASTAHPAGAP